MFGQSKPNSGPHVTHYVINCVTLCEKAQRAILENVQREYSSFDEENVKVSSLAAIEIKLWNDLKKFNETKDYSTISYLVGFYSSLVTQVLLRCNASNNDLYFVMPVSALMYRLEPSIAFDEELGSSFKNIRTLLYNIHIRLGDLNRYLKDQRTAKLCYLEARELNPLRGHAYNQLSLISTEDPMMQLYYYVRACCAYEEPLDIAEKNLKVVVNKMYKTNPLVRLLFDKSESTWNSNLVQNWFFVVVVASYAEGLKNIAGHLIEATLNWLREEVGCNPFSSAQFENTLAADDKFLLPAMDVYLDITLQSSLKNIGHLEKPLNALKSEVTAVLSQSDDFAINSTQNALKHDYELLGFGPLVAVHKKLVFQAKGFDETKFKSQFVILIKKISNKIDRLLTSIDAKSPVNRLANVQQLDPSEKYGSNLAVK
ncbi:hypothetical protein HDE_01928 [Halotydeus destructor]|nr:hypothetical protein HDE_01928 [Halotydeus destructor]